MRAAVAGVAAVTNLEPSGGGSDAEPLERVRDRGPRALRHGGRAVAAGDYEDLAAEASAQVARARCRPPGVNPLDVAWIDPVPVAPPGPEAASVLCHADDATAAARAAADPAGRVGVTVVPGLDTTQPTPSQGLLDEVRAALLAAGPAVLPAGRLDVAGPDWVEVAVHATVAATSLATAVTAPTAVIEALERFLHPLHGGSDGGGWPFGRLPHPSDLIAVVAAVPGVDHGRSLDVTTVPDPATLSAEQLRTTLVASGAHSVVVAGIGEAS
jgi:predicted phage baseplate assembly protein